MEQTLINTNVAKDKQWTFLEKSKSNMSAKFRSRHELKSSIPKPSPCLRSLDKTKLKTSSSFHSQPACISRIPLSTFRSAERGKTSASLQYGMSSTIPQPHSANENRARSFSPRSRPQSGNVKNNPYAHVKAKVNTKLSPSVRKSRYNSVNVYDVNLNDSNSDYLVSRPCSSERTTGGESEPQGSPHNINQTIIRNQYSHTKTKENSKITRQSRPNSPGKPSNIYSLRSKDPSLEDNKLTPHSDLESDKISGGENTPSNEELLEKQKQLLSLYNELRKLQPAKDRQPLEREIFRMMQNKTLGHLEGITREHSFLSEGAPEFLVTFEKEMKEMFNSWLQLICDVITSRQMANTSAMSRLPLPDSTLNLFDEICKYLINLPSDGEPLPQKLQKIEEEQRKVMTVIMHSVMALTKEHEDLKDQHFRLEKTQDQIHFELKEELAILGEENEKLDRKYALAVEKYNLEKAKADQQEKYQLIIQKDLSEVKKIMKVIEGKNADWENKVKKMDATCRSLDVAIRDRDLISERDNKQHRQFQKKFTEAEETINKLSSELGDVNRTRQSLEEANQKMKDEISLLKNAQEDSVRKRNALVEELSNKSKKLTDLEVELETLKKKTSDGKESPDYASKILIEDLTNDIKQRDVLISDQRKKIGQMEHTLKELSTKEDLLMKQVMELQKKPYEIETAMKAQIKELKYEVNDLVKERNELERIIAQKTIELDQRDLLMHEHAQILRARDDLIPLIKNKKGREKECIEKLSAVIYEHRKTYYDKENNNLYNNDRQNSSENVKDLQKHYSMDPNLVEKELSFRQEKMNELFSLLEHKQMEMMKLERRMRELQLSKNCI